MSAWLLGASLVCPKCLLRAATAPCPRCGRPMEDLAEAGGFQRLSARWSASRAFLAGRSLLSLRAIRHLKVLVRLCAGLSALCALAPLLGPALAGEPMPHGADWLLPVVVGLVMAPFVFVFFAVFFFAWAHVCRVLAVLVGAAAHFSPIGVGRLSLAATAFRLVSRPLLPQIELAWPPEKVDGARLQHGQLDAPLELHLLRDSLSLIERFDAWADAMAVVRLDGQPDLVLLEHGAVELDPLLGARTELKSKVPGWLAAPGRPGVTCTRTLPAGTQVTLERRGALVLLRLSSPSPRPSEPAAS